MIGIDHIWILAIALCLDALFGDPETLWRRLRHPVVWIGDGVAAMERRLNQKAWSPVWRRTAGAATLTIVVAASAAAGWIIEAGFTQLPYGWIGVAICAAILLAGRSLYDHVAAVATAFDANGLPSARGAVARIVGRDPATLEEAGVCRAAIESAAENFSDGLVAPALWFALLGLPGLAAYKAINTADSMIGHRSDRYRDFGWAAARVDDVVNLPASRLSGVLIAAAAPIVGGSVGHALRTMRTEAPKHRSPNAGWPEGAAASALGVALAGPRRYRGILVDDPFVNPDGRRQATPTDIRRMLRLYLGAWGLLFAIVAILSGVILVR
ncbi:adenosylcobinamide-phosphate synthase CbiB [Bauldia sp.]|uniref:adenosylcobinamide-phosphate synthase CbiB n=1 Tax=Bauldia sp. TaxID=2575872 RepID=UPI003BAD1FE4